MYVTRPLSMYKKSPNSGIPVVKDEETTCCFELSNIDLIKELPFPQNKSLELYYSTWFYPNRDLQLHGVFFIPVLGPYGKDKGEGYTSANEDSMDMETCCFDSCTNDVLPQRFDPKDMYQQYKINLQKNIINVSCRSMSKDGYPPEALWRKGWKLTRLASPGFEVGDARA